MRNKFLFLGQYPLDIMNSAPKIRTYNLYQEISKLTETDFITGTRRSRRLPLLKYILSGKLFRVRAIYLEAATSTSMETDIILLILAKILRIPIGIFIRDMYPIFNLIDSKPLKHKLLILAWKISIFFYKRTAKVLFFPSEGLANVWPSKGNFFEVLPPGGRVIDFETLDSKSKGVLFSGGVSKSRYSINMLLEAGRILYHHKNYKDLKVYLVCSKENKKELDSEWLNEPWVEIRHLDYFSLVEIKKEIYVCVIPSENTKYEDMVFPVKLFDYMSLGKPILATNSKEIARFVQKHEVGLICDFNPEDMADKIAELLDNPEKANQYALNSYHTVQEGHLWKHRAQQIINTLLKN